MGHIGEAFFCVEQAEMCEALGFPQMVDAWGPGLEPLLLGALSHHGRPPRKPSRTGSGPPKIWKPFAGYDPRETAAMLHRCARAWFPGAFSRGPRLPESPALAHLFAGIVALADQIGSDQGFFGFEPDPDPDYIVRARERAREAVGKKGLCRAGRRARVGAAGLSTMFGHERSHPCRSRRLRSPRGHANVPARPLGARRTAHERSHRTRSPHHREVHRRPPRRGQPALPEHLLLIIDEASMVDLFSAYRLVRVLPEAARLLFVGDEAQLPPVGPGSVFHALIGAGLPVSRLSQFKRHDRDSEIYRVASALRRGIVPVIPRLHESPGAQVTHTPNLRAEHVEQLWLQSGRPSEPSSSRPPERGQEESTASTCGYSVG